MSASVKVLGISGSLRRNSYNTAALRAAQELAPSEMRIEMADCVECSRSVAAVKLPSRQTQ